MLEEVLNLYVDMINYCNLGNVNQKVLNTTVKTYTNLYKKLGIVGQGELALKIREYFKES